MTCLHQSAPVLTCQPLLCIFHNSNQEDRSSVSTLSLDPLELQLTLKLNHTGIEWQPATISSLGSKNADNTPPEDTPQKETVLDNGLHAVKPVENESTAEASQHNPQTVTAALDEANRQVGYFAIFDG
jgi:hypothetical protein